MALNRQLATPSYLVAFALACIPPIDGLVQALPLRFGDARWRFGVFGLLSNSMMLSLAGVLVAFAASSAFEHRRFQRVLGIIVGIAALAILGALALFGLDALQIRSQVQPVAQLAFRAASTEAVVKALLSAITLAAFAVAAFRGPKPPRRETMSKRDSLVVGTTGTVAPGLRPQPSGERSGGTASDALGSDNG